MPDLITSKRLDEIKARVNARNAEVCSGSYARTATLDFVDYATHDVPDLAATLERAVDLLRRQNKAPQSLEVFQNIGTFLKEFDHD